MPAIAGIYFLQIFNNNGITKVKIYYSVFLNAY